MPPAKAFRHLKVWTTGIILFPIFSSQQRLKRIKHELSVANESNRIEWVASGGKVVGGLESNERLEESLLYPQGRPVTPWRGIFR